MIRQIALLTLRDGCEPEQLAEFEAALDGAARVIHAVGHSQLGRHLEGSLCGHYTWDASLSDPEPLPLECLVSEDPLSRYFDPDSRDCIVADIDAVRFEPQETGIQEPRLQDCIKRTLLVRVLDGTPLDVRERFEHDIMRMPDYVSTIRNWAFSRTDPSLHSTGWTHVWEQEYEEIDGLMSEYMLSPFHWGYIDGWFDPECPQRIVDGRFAHVFCRARESVLAWK